MAEFVDRVTLHATAGSGGHGCTSIHREKFKPLGGPDGGDGGNGGDVTLVVDPQVTTLVNYYHRPHQKAGNGQPGQGSHRCGANGEDLVLPVPMGTVVKDEKGNVIADMAAPGDTFVVARGGRGGLGNAALSTSKRKAPGFALLGEPGDEVTVVLELKSIADVALVGFPSAGKSSLIAALSAARPKIADYPFTTLIPNLGVVEAGAYRYTIADVPGLIPGAAQGRGLGHEFLRHIERCAILAHVVDAASFDPERDPLNDIKALEKELAAYAQGLQELDGYVPLTQRPRVIIVNKIDVPDGAEMAEFTRSALLRLGWPLFEVSAVSRAGLDELTYGLGRLVEEHRVARAATENVRPVIRPVVASGPAFTVTLRNTGTGTVFQVRGEKPERWVKQTDFTNGEAVGFLADRLNGLGVEAELIKQGARVGDEVVIGDLDKGVVFDFEPTMTTGAELLGARGQDLRLEDTRRPTRAEKRAAYYERMDAKEAARQNLRDEAKQGLWTDPRNE